MLVSASSFAESALTPTPRSFSMRQTEVQSQEGGLWSNMASWPRSSPATATTMSAMLQQTTTDPGHGNLGSMSLRSPAVLQPPQPPSSAGVKAETVNNYDGFVGSSANGSGRQAANHGSTTADSAHKAESITSWAATTLQASSRPITAANFASSGRWATEESQFGTSLGRTDPSNGAGVSTANTSGSTFQSNVLMAGSGDSATTTWPDPSSLSYPSTTAQVAHARSDSTTTIRSGTYPAAAVASTWPYMLSRQQHNGSSTGDGTVSSVASSWPNYSVSNATSGWAIPQNYGASQSTSTGAAVAAATSATTQHSVGSAMPAPGTFASRAYAASGLDSMGTNGTTGAAGAQAYSYAASYPSSYSSTLGGASSYYTSYPAGMANPTLAYFGYAPMVKQRRRTTKEQFTLLEATFRETPKPTPAARKALSKQVGMTDRAVQIWFQNRRAKAKAQAKKVAAASAAASEKAGEGGGGAAGGNLKPTTQQHQYGHMSSQQSQLQKPQHHPSFHHSQYLSHSTPLPTGTTSSTCGSAPSCVSDRSRSLTYDGTSEASSVSRGVTPGMGMERVAMRSPQQ